MLAPSGRIDETAMIAMNSRAELQGARFADIVRDFLKATGSAGSLASPAPTFSPATGPAQVPAAKVGLRGRLFDRDLGRLTLQHLMLVGGSALLAILIGVPLGIALAARPRLKAWTLALTGMLQTIPSLALLAMLVGLTGMIGAVPALVALTLYALLPIVRNTCTGLAGVPDGLKDAARALGLSNRDRLLRIELPLAMPVIIAGIRTATAIGVGTATIAAFIGAGGYGERIVTGLALNDGTLLLAGALPAAALALLLEGLFELAERRRRWSAARAD
jgi:osmoprotectant transport system permease protein